jgi:hypothetical protein
MHRLESHKDVLQAKRPPQEAKYSEKPTQLSRKKEKEEK